ncbi:fibronectin type III domain-containing protein [Saccharothrix sp.]|uniref:fibronectin type III domain-containing protein n=1 Tax=Saccharothrix sp. TaxID=1873460 RepID=UPI0035C81B92
MTQLKRLLIPLVLLTSCATQEPSGLTATLTSSTDVTLSWRPTPDAAGQAVEYAHDPNGDYTVLQFASPDTNTYTHPDLIPQTPFYYRIRPYYGPASAEEDVTLPPGDEVSTEDGHEWAAPQKGNTGTHPARSPAAKPTNFTATVKHANGILFTWTDNAQGEHGYLLEVRPHNTHTFQVAAALDPDTHSFGLITLPTEKTATYRVRPYTYGEPTNTAHQRTGG